MTMKMNNSNVDVNRPTFLSKGNDTKLRLSLYCCFMILICKFFCNTLALLSKAFEESRRTEEASKLWAMKIQNRFVVPAAAVATSLVVVFFVRRPPSKWASSSPILFETLPFR